MATIIRTRLRLLPGVRLYYECPRMGMDFESDRFFNAHRGKTAEFVGYAEELVAPFDSRGRMPGRYARYDTLTVRFDGEEPHALNANHFVLFEASSAVLAEVADDNRIGDLPQSVLFYPGDRVRFSNKPEERISDEVHEVDDVFVGHPLFAPGEVPRYWVKETDAEFKARSDAFREKYPGVAKNPLSMGTFRDPIGWNVAAGNLELVSRDKVWALYEAPEHLSFENDKAAHAFWAQDGASKRLSDEDAKAAGEMASAMSPIFGRPLDAAYSLFESGEADLIYRSHLTPPRGEPGYLIRRLHECFAHYRLHVRECTERLWEERARRTKA